MYNICKEHRLKRVPSRKKKSVLNNEICRHLQAMVRGAITCIDHNYNVHRQQVIINIIGYSGFDYFIRSILIARLGWETLLKITGQPLPRHS
jgi:hypothetical protein